QLLYRLLESNTFLACLSSLPLPKREIALKDFSVLQKARKNALWKSSEAAEGGTAAGEYHSPGSESTNDTDYDSPTGELLLPGGQNKMKHSTQHFE
ncbi:unnamed protein product, partial [Amoebophrya sp. A120]